VVVAISDVDCEDSSEVMVVADVSLVLPSAVLVLSLVLLDVRD